MKIECEFHYDSAHFLPKVPEGHKCSRLHGHTYVLYVSVQGLVGEDGFIIDFADVKAVVDPVIKELDHYLLNDVPGLENPTVEIQLKWLWMRLRGGLDGLCKLRLREGLSNEASYP